MLAISHCINQRSSIIPIKKNLNTQMDVNSPKGEYSRKQNFFDPSKSSPPNEFMLKLHMRILNYDTKDDSCDNE
jgi:hypothetical protein